MLSHSASLEPLASSSESHSVAVPLFCFRLLREASWQSFFVSDGKAMTLDVEIGLSGSGTPKRFHGLLSNTCIARKILINLSVINYIFRVL